MMIALDISAAFDMVLHSILLHRLNYSFGLRTLRSDGSSRICQSAHRSFESAQLRNRQYAIGEFLNDRSLDQSFSPFIYRRWRKLPMHTELYSNNMMTRNYTLLCPRCHQRSYRTTSKLCHCSTPMVCRE